MADIERLIGFMALMQVPFMSDPDVLMYIEEVKTVLKQVKAQEPVKPVAKQEADEVTSDILNAAYCGKCGVRIGRQKVNFCSNCGREVNWDGWIAEPHRK